jgi:hypothetical protein
VHVLGLATGAFRRTVTLPLELNGAMTYLPPPLDLLAFADNRNDRLVTFERVDPGSGNLMQAYSPTVPVGQFVVTRDGVPLGIQLVGLAYDAVAERLWCTDALAGRLFQLDLSAGNEGQSLTGSESYSSLFFDLDPDMAPDPLPVLPSAVAFDGTDLYLIHAVDPVDARVRRLSRADVDPAGLGVDTVIDAFGTLLPENAPSIADGNIFLRFRILIDGEKDVGATMFRKVRVDSIVLTYENEPF